MPAATPINQQDALPLYSPITGANGGNITLVGNNLTRFWSGAALGLDSVGSPGNWITRAPQINLESASLDWRGCSQFGLVCLITNGTAAPLAAGAAWAVYLCHGTSAGNFPLVDANAGNIVTIGTMQITSALAIGASVVRNAPFAADQVVGAFGTLGCAGAFWQIVISTNVVANTSAGVAFTCELWGAT